MLHEGSTLNFYFLLKYILLQPLGLLAFFQISCFNSEACITKSTLKITEKCSPGCPAYFHTRTTIPESHVTTSPNTTLHEKLYFLDYSICVTDCCTESL